MSNEQLMQNKLEKAISSLDDVTTDELSNEELNDISGGVTVRFEGFRRRRQCVRRSRRFQGNDLD
ncbi:MAG: hypothetical protein KME64_28315 [Scytonematopsis contorta HA4267-MV1]|jgi:C-terminal processing protease CtpA/Prc|nr:hypothetical protein [Scytonematopsis contorta HA4267-MV1]